MPSAKPVFFFLNEKNISGDSNGEFVQILLGGTMQRSGVPRQVKKVSVPQVPELVLGNGATSSSSCLQTSVDQLPSSSTVLSPARKATNRTGSCGSISVSHTDRSNERLTSLATIMQTAVTPTSVSSAGANSPFSPSVAASQSFTFPAVKISSSDGNGGIAVTPRHRNSTGSNSSQGSSGFESMKSSSNPYVNVQLQTLRGDSPPSRNSYHSSGSSSLGSLERLDESGCPSSNGSSSHCLSVLEMAASGVSDAEIISRWLQKLNYDEYILLFLNAGYDLTTIARMTPEDLTAVGITKPGHRKRLTAEIHRLNLPDNLPHFKPDFVCEWLALLQLQEYNDFFSKQGYVITDAVVQLTWEDLEDIGITKLGHLKKLSLAIKRLKELKNGRPSHDSPLRLPLSVSANIANGHCNGMKSPAGRPVASPDWAARSMSLPPNDVLVINVPPAAIGASSAKHTAEVRPNSHVSSKGSLSPGGMSTFQHSPRSAGLDPYNSCGNTNNIVASAPSADSGCQQSRLLSQRSRQLLEGLAPGNCDTFPPRSTANDNNNHIVATTTDAVVQALPSANGVTNNNGKPVLSVRPVTKSLSHDVGDDTNIEDVKKRQHLVNDGAGSAKGKQNYLRLNIGRLFTAPSRLNQQQQQASPHARFGRNNSTGPETSLVGIGYSAECVINEQNLSPRHCSVSSNSNNYPPSHNSLPQYDNCQQNGYSSANNNIHNNCNGFSTSGPPPPPKRYGLLASHALHSSNTYGTLPLPHHGHANNNNNYFNADLSNNGNMSSSLHFSSPAPSSLGFQLTKASTCISPANSLDDFSACDEEFPDPPSPITCETTIQVLKSMMFERPRIQTPSVFDLDVACYPPNNCSQSQQASFADGALKSRSANASPAPSHRKALTLLPPADSRCNGSQGSINSNSSNEALPFANENVGTIKQKSCGAVNDQHLYGLGEAFARRPLSDMLYPMSSQVAAGQQNADLDDLNDMLQNLTQELDALLVQESKQGSKAQEKLATVKN